MEPDTQNFLDVDQLLERSEPRPRTNWVWYIGGGFLLLMMVSSYIGMRSPAAERVVTLLSPLFTLGLITCLAVYSSWIARRNRDEMAALQGIEELVQLRRWSQAAGEIGQLLNRPPRNPIIRPQALFFLGNVLARYHRFDDAVHVFEHLLETVRMDESTANALRLGRAMALLREDRLVDADRAIAELRRSADREESGGLALVEMYRSVKTGHPDDATATFEQRLGVLRDRLGVRVADAYALAARAYDMMFEHDKAQAAWAHATVLAPAEELVRRYPELRKTADARRAAVWPADII